MWWWGGDRKGISFSLHPIQDTYGYALAPCRPDRMLGLSTHQRLGSLLTLVFVVDVVHLAHTHTHTHTCNETTRRINWETKSQQILRQPGLVVIPVVAVVVMMLAMVMIVVW